MTAPTVADNELCTLLDNVMSSAQNAGTTVDLDHSLWRTLHDLGLTTIMSEQDGSWADAVAALRAAAGHAAAVPLAEHDLLANWLRRRAELPGTDEISTVALCDADGRAARVPWASQADRVVVLQVAGDAVRISDHPVAALQIDPDRDIAGRPTDSVRLTRADAGGSDVSPDVLHEYRLRGALARSAQISGALTSAAAMTAQYARERTQFVRPIVSFQAVAHLIVDAVAESVLAATAVDAAAASADLIGIDAPATAAAVATAKSVTGRAASVVVRNAHQVHGAMGTTAEHPLAQRTKPVLAWREEFGSTVEWETQIAAALTGRTDSVWSWVTSAV